MPKTYYDSELTGAQIDGALEAIHGVVTPSNNGKVLYIDNGQIKAASASRWGHGAVLEPLSVTANGDYTPPTGTDGFDEVHVAVPSATLTTKSITQNGTYNASQDNADGYSSVTVSVSGGGGEGPIYSGTSAPNASIGTDEDLYIQYETLASPFDHTYRIVAQYRKINGAWTQYTAPTLPTTAVHIWTASVSGGDAAMNVQAGYWDTDNNVFVTTGEVERVIYNSVLTWDTAKDCNGVALLAYPGAWQIKASTTVTDGTNTYQADTIVASWGYGTRKDIYIWKPLST